MKALLYTTVFVSVVILVSCEESPFISKEDATKLMEEVNENRDPLHGIQNVVAIIDNDVYYFDRLDIQPRKLTNSPSSAKTDVKLSHDRSRIAYVNANGNPVIIRSDNGEVIATLTQFAYPSQIDWAKDELTLYMLIDREVVSYGGVLPISQPASTHPWDDVTSFSMNSIGDQGYFIKFYGNFNHTFMYQSVGQWISEEYQSFNGEAYDYIDFYDNTGNFLLAQSDYWGDGYSEIIVVEDYNFWPAFEWDYENMYTPSFNSQREVLLYGKVEGGYAIKAVYLGTDAYDGSGIYDVLSLTLTDYPSQTPIYLDWVQ